MIMLKMPRVSILAVTLRHLASWDLKSDSAAAQYGHVDVGMPAAGLWTAVIVTLVILQSLTSLGVSFAS